MAAQKGGRMSERAILKTLMVYFLIGCFLVSNIPCTYASSGTSINSSYENKTEPSEYTETKVPEHVETESSQPTETDPSENKQTENSENTSTGSSNYTEAESSEHTKIKSSQYTKTESSEYKIKHSDYNQGENLDNVQTKTSEGTDLPKNSKPAPPSASVSLHGEKTQVISGEDILLRLSAVNLITKPVMHVQVIIIPPSGMSVSSSEFVQSGAGQYTTTYELDPGQGRDIEVRIESNQPGDFNVEGRVVYYFGEDIENAEDYTLNLPIQVETKSYPVEKALPGFTVASLAFVLMVVFILKRH